MAIESGRLQKSSEEGLESNQELVLLSQQVHEALSRGPTLAEVAIPSPPTRIGHLQEVKDMLLAVLASRWGAKVERLRARPTLEDLEGVLRGAPPGNVFGDSLQGLVSIVNRGKALADFASQIWVLPPETPVNEVLAKCEKALELSRELPLEMTQLLRGLNACVEDQAMRHCECGMFDDGKTMYSCVRCERWFHAECVGKNHVSEEGGVSDAEDFTCTQCRLGECVL